MVHIYNGRLLLHKKETIMPFAAMWMDLEIVIHSKTGCYTEWSKSDREGQISYVITYMWKLKKGYKWTYLQNGNRVTDVKNKLMVTRV